MMNEAKRLRPDNLSAPAGCSVKYKLSCIARTLGPHGTEVSWSSVVGAWVVGWSADGGKMWRVIGDDAARQMSARELWDTYFAPYPHLLPESLREPKERSRGGKRGGVTQ